MNIFKRLRLFLRYYLKEFSKWYIERYGYFVIDKKYLYDWQINPNYYASYDLKTKISDGAKEYLNVKNPRLIQLKSADRKFITERIDKGLWAEDYLKKEDLLFFRGDNPYAYQKRGNQLSVLAYIITYLWLKSNVQDDNLLLLNDEKSFGVFAYEIDGKIITRDLLDSINEIEFLKENVFSKFNSKIEVLEIGAGYGRLAKWLTKDTTFIEHYYCTDGIAESTFISEYFLKEYHKINQVSVVPINQINNLMKNQNISLAINIHSFSEMTIDFVKFWIDKINKMKIQYLFIVPNSGEEYKGDLISLDKIWIVK